MKRLAVSAVCLALALVFSACVQQQVTADQIKDMQAQMAEMQKSVANLNLRLEELNNSVFILQETAKANREAVKTLKEEMEKPTVYISTTPDRESSLVNPLPQGGEPRHAAGFHQGMKSPQPVLPPSGGGSDFDEATRQFNSGNYGLAAYDLAAYLSRNGGAPNATQARYMLAESYFRLGDHSQAAREFALVMTRCAGALCARATLRSAQCFAASGQPVKARELFKKVVSLYPGTEEAKTAVEDLSKL